MPKRYRRRATKPGVLAAYYGKDDGGEVDIVISHGPGTHGADAALLWNTLSKTWATSKSLIDELAARGYDITTLRFSISKGAAARKDGGDNG